MVQHHAPRTRTKIGTAERRLADAHTADDNRRTRRLRLHDQDRLPTDRRARRDLPFSGTRSHLRAAALPRPRVRAPHALRKGREHDPGVPNDRDTSPFLVQGDGQPVRLAEGNNGPDQPLRPAAVTPDGPRAEPLAARPRNLLVQHRGDEGLEMGIALRVVGLAADLQGIPAAERSVPGELPGQVREHVVEILVLAPVGDPRRALALIDDVPDLHLRAGIDVPAPRANDSGVGGAATNIEMGKARAHVEGLAGHHGIRTGGAQHRFEQPVRAPAEGRLLERVEYLRDILAGDQLHLHVPLDLRLEGAHDQGLDPVRDRVGKPRVGGGEGPHEDLRPPFQVRDQLLDKEIDGPLRRAPLRLALRGRRRRQAPDTEAEQRQQARGQPAPRTTPPVAPRRPRNPVPPRAPGAPPGRNPSNHPRHHLLVTPRGHGNREGNPRRGGTEMPSRVR